MARITPSALIDDIKGSIGGVTFSSWKGMSYVKAKAKSVRNPATEDQVLIRNGMTFFARRYFDDLTDNQRAIWDQYAQEVAGAERSDQVQGGFGSRVVPQRQWNRSGYNWFIALNIGLLQALGVAHLSAPIDDAPLGQSPPSQPSFTALTYDNVLGVFESAGLAPADFGHATSLKLRFWVLPNWGYARIQQRIDLATEGAPFGPTQMSTMKIQRAVLPAPLPDGLYAFQADCVGIQNGLYSPPSDIIKVAAKFVGP